VQNSNFGGVCIDATKLNGFFKNKKPFEQTVAEMPHFFANSEESSGSVELCPPFFFSGSSKLYFY